MVLKFTPSAKIQAIIHGTDLYLNKLAPSVGPKIFSTKEIDGRLVEGGRLEGTDDREETSPPFTKEQIEGHVSALKSLVKSNNRRNKGDPIRLDFELEDTEFERFPPDSINEWADLREAFATRFSVRRACFKEPYEITKIIRRANESLTAFKERWTVETFFIMRVSEVMKISSFMDSVKSPELTKHFLNKVPTTVNEMMERLDDFFWSEEAYASIELPKGETGESHRKTSFASNRRDEKGHYTNDYIQLRKQLEMALESRKLNHLVKDVRQGGRGPHGRDDPQPAKIVNVISVNSMKDKKRKV
nr:reverse transcriptase domain-containing protein [Tanacetum cinerariifolium]